MAWTFDIFAFIPVCILLFISTLVPQGFAQLTACDTCVKTTTGGLSGQWCLKSYPDVSPVPVGASYCLPKDVKTDACLGGDASTACPPAPGVNYNNEATEPADCAACAVKQQSWCVQTTPANNFCIKTDLASTKCAESGKGGTHSLDCPDALGAAATRTVAGKIAGSSCTACLNAHADNKWCIKDYGTTKSAFCVLSTTEGACAGGVMHKPCPPAAVDRRVTMNDVQTCEVCVNTHKQKWCIKGPPGPTQYRACIPTGKLTAACPLSTTGIRQLGVCTGLTGQEPNATPPEVQTAAAEDTTKVTVAPAGDKDKTTAAAAGDKDKDTTTKGSDASTLGVLTGTVLSMLVATA